MSESLAINLYSRFYRDMLLNELKAGGLGEFSSKIMREHHSDYEGGVKAIRHTTNYILGKEPAYRDNSENLFIFGLMRQKNNINSFYQRHQCLLYK